MVIALWIVEGLLGLIFVITGSFKFFQSKEKVIASGGTWAENYQPSLIKIIAATEIISGILVIVPKLLWDARYLTFMGAAGIVLIMIGSIFTHVRRNEFKHGIINSVFLLMAVFVAYMI